MKSAISSGEGLSPDPKSSPGSIFKLEQSDGISKSTNTATSELTVESRKSGLQVVHATPGRFRLRATDRSLKSRLNTISQQLQQQDGVEKVCTNQQTGSLVVTFDENKLSKSQIYGLLQQVGVSEPPAPLPEAKADPFAAWKSVDFWREQGREFIPLITGVLVTGRLGIHGWPGIPVYLIAASATRQLIAYLEPEVASDANETSQEIERALKRKSLAVDKANDLAAQSATVACKVIHATPGRIRLKVPRIIKDRTYAQRLQRLIEADALVTTVRVNCEAASLVITYQPGAIPVSHWVGLIQLADEATAPTDLTTVPTQQLLSETASQATVPIDSTTASVQPTPKVASPWAELKPPALAASLAYMAKLPSLWLTPASDASTLALLALTPRASLRWCCQLAHSVSKGVSHIASRIQSASNAVVATEAKKLLT